VTLGREAVGSAGWFDFVGYLEASVTGPGKVRGDAQAKFEQQFVGNTLLPPGWVRTCRLTDNPLAALL
jgi:hypothetical protein